MEIDAQELERREAFTRARLLISQHVGNFLQGRHGALLDHLRLNVCNRKPDMIIGPENEEYLHRWYVIPRNREENIYLHKFLRSDDDRALHDHPWSWNFSWLLDGCYDEQTFDGDSNLDEDGIGFYRADGSLPGKKMTARLEGDWVTRIGPAPHRVVLRGSAVWTLFITGPVMRKWGFYCPKGWRDSDLFLEATDGVRHVTGFSKVGRGCGD